MRQDWLLPYENPLAKRLSERFFAELPKTPGVYRMIGAAGQILYVGKAKNLRNRLRSYRNARPHEVSRKVIRMLNLVVEIQWEPCASEEAALLRENELLRAERPPFNVVNKRPEGYLFVALTVSPDAKAAFHLMTDPAAAPKGSQIYGAYKGTVQRGIVALLRVLWAVTSADASNNASDDASDGARFEIPSRLLGFRAPTDFSVRLKPDALDQWVSHLHRFLKGTSPALLPLITGALLDNASIPPFYYRMLQEDLELLKDFYAMGPRRHRRLVRFRGRLDAKVGQVRDDEERIAQGELDDLLVRYRFREEKKK